MITPNDIENYEFKTTALGYSKEDVEDFRDKLIADYEKVFRDNIKLNTRVKNLEENIKRYDNMEESIKTSILLAEKTAKETRSNAKEQAENILDRAKIDAEKLVSKTLDQKNEIEKEIFSLKKKYQLLKAKMQLLLDAELKMLNDPAFALFDEDEDDMQDYESVSLEESDPEPLTVPDHASEMKEEQEKKLKVLAELFDDDDEEEI